MDRSYYPNCVICYTNAKTFKLTTIVSSDQMSLLQQLEFLVPAVQWYEEHFVCEACIHRMLIYSRFKQQCLLLDYPRSEYDGVDDADDGDGAGIPNEEVDVKPDSPVWIEDHSITSATGLGDWDGAAAELEADGTGGDDYQVQQEEDIIEAESDEIMWPSDAHGSASDEGQVQQEENAIEAGAEVEAAAEEPAKGSKKVSRSRTFPCQVCGSRFTPKEILEHCLLEHSIDAKDVKPYRCDTCEAGFKSAWGLCQHRKHHDNLCGICRKGFTSPAKLSDHERKHLDEEATTTSRCDVCDKVFKTARSLDLHKRKMHSGDRRHGCETCGKWFLSKTSLVTHGRRTHLQEKNFFCGTCKKGFFSKAELIRHESIFIKRCEFCQLKTMKRCAYTTHRMEAHWAEIARLV